MSLIAKPIVNENILLWKKILSFPRPHWNQTVVLVYWYMYSMNTHKTGSPDTNDSVVWVT